MLQAELFFADHSIYLNFFRDVIMSENIVFIMTAQGRKNASSDVAGFGVRNLITERCKEYNRYDP